MEKLSIVIIDDHALLRRGFTAALENHSKWEVAGEAATLEEAKTLLAAMPELPRLLILDIALPGNEWGLALLPWLEEQYGKKAPPVLVYSGFSDYAHIQTALGMGVKGYVSKDEGLPVLENAMNTVARGEVFVNHELYARLPAAPGNEMLLTRREKQVLLLVRQGSADSHIREHLHIGQKTLESYLYSIYKKLSVRSRKELIQLKP